jgi:hypothetical protein
MAMTKNSFIANLLYETVDKYLPSGIFQHLCEEGVWRIYKFRDKLVEEKRRILSMSDLEFGFVLWLGACGLATVVFIFELLGRFKHQLRQQVGFILFYRLLKIRLRNVYS